MSDWHGDSPFFLVVERVEGGNVGIDLDQPGWIADHQDLMRSPGTWVLYIKESGTPLFAVVIEEGDQAYFAKRHVGNLFSGNELVAFGIGKKKEDGETVRLWVLPNGLICGGDDVETIASRMLG